MDSFLLMMGGFRTEFIGDDLSPIHFKRLGERLIVNSDTESPYICIELWPTCHNVLRHHQKVETTTYLSFDAAITFIRNWQTSKPKEYTNDTI